MADSPPSLSARNAEAIASTLVHHGKKFDELHRAIQELHTMICSLQQEVVQHKGLIYRSLVNKHGTGSTVPEDA